MRRPLGTYFARPSGQESLTSESGLMNVLLYLNGIVAESICCQTLCLNSLASLADAVRTIFGEPTEAPPRLALGHLPSATGLPAADLDPAVRMIVRPDS